MARTFWPGESALGHRVRFPGPQQTSWRTIVGVVADMKNGGVDRPTGTELFVPWRQARPVGPFAAIRTMQIVVHTVAAPLSMVNSVRSAISQLDPSLPIAGVRSMQEVVSQSQSRPRFLSVLLTFFTSIALALAAIGVYGVISYSVARRTSEIGIRMAVGADRSRILFLVIKQGALLGLTSLAVGVAAAIWLTRFMKSILFAIEPLDVPTFAATVVLLFGLTLLATWIPARRATLIDPTVALRYD
jgi:ABC-type antimicrobial peptide transport system permease subunit